MLRCFPVNFVKFLRTCFLQTTFRQLLLWFLRNLFSFLTRPPLSGCFCILKHICYAEIVGPATAKDSNRKSDEFHRFSNSFSIDIKRIMQLFADVIQNKCFFSKFHRETPVLQSVFKEFAGLSLATLSKKDSKTGLCL